MCQFGVDEVEPMDVDETEPMRVDDVDMLEVDETEPMEVDEIRADSGLILLTKQISWSNTGMK